MGDPLLSVRDLRVEYVTPTGSVVAVQDVSFDVHAGEFLGLAGESGSGKSTLIKALMRILPPPGIITGGQVRFDGKDLLRLDEEALRQVRWRDISMVFQSAMDALNPVLTVHDQLADTLRAHGERDRRVIQKRIVELLELVDLDPRRAGAYPHELSGGMRQRVVIAIALALSPRLIIMDEPTTALDVVVERSILRRVNALREELGFGVLFITHDLPRMLEMCDRMGVIYSGRLVELGPVTSFVHSPTTHWTGARHPYTRGLLTAFPSLTGPRTGMRGIAGAPPSLSSPPPGCRFAPRCDLAVSACQTEPELSEVATGHLVRCPETT